MRKLLNIVFILFLSINIIGQECPAEQIFFIQDGAGVESISSDLYAPTNATLAADNFILDEAADINTVCWPGDYWYLGDEGLEGRENIGVREIPCDVDNKNFRITYYIDGGGIPGNVTYTEDVVPTLILNEGAFVEHYYYSATHANVSLPANITHWVSIQNIDDDDCEFFLVGGLPLPPLQRDEIQTREFDGHAINTTAGWIQSRSSTCINLVLGAVALPPIPTLSQWGVFILGLLVMIFGASYIRSSIRIAE